MNGACDACRRLLAMFWDNIAYRVGLVAYFVASVLSRRGRGTGQRCHLSRWAFRVAVSPQRR